AMAVSLDGHVYVLDNGRKRVVIYGQNGRVEREDVEVGVSNEDLRGIAVDPWSGSLAVLERNQGAVKIFARTKEGWSNSAKSTSMGAEDVAALRKPVRIRMDATRVVYALDRDGESLARFDAADRADFCGRVGNVELSDNVRLAATADCGIVALDKSKSVAIRFNARGWATAKMGLESQGPQGHLRTPVGVGVDGDGAVVVLDAKKCEIEKYIRGGVWDKSFGSKAVLQEIRSGQMSSHREKFIVVMQGDKPCLGVMDLQSGEIIKYAAIDADSLELGAFAGRFAGKDAKDEEASFWFVDKGGERVSRFTLANQAPVAIVQNFKTVTGIATNVAGAVFLCDKDAKAIEVFAGNGTKLGSISDDKELRSPADVAADDLGRLYVFDDSKVRILELAE
ncbi:MAG: hypothetical protein ACAI25_07410, partial [Planctomycetota bacterium]